MDISKHIVTSANWDSGRGGHAVTGIVLHTMVGYMQPSENRFNDPNSQVSVHYGVGLNGTIRQWVEEGNTAYQAGNYSVNQTTIGIEHEDAGNANDAVRTAALYESSSSLVADICQRYGFPADTNHIFLHKNVIDKSAYPGGTACPDALDTNKIISMAQAKLGDHMAALDVIRIVASEIEGYDNYTKIHSGQDDAALEGAWGSKPIEDYIRYAFNLKNPKRTDLVNQIADLKKQLAAKGGGNETVLKPGDYRVN